MGEASTMYLMARNLSDTPFSTSRLIIWTLGVASILSLIFITVLAILEIDIPPSLTMAFGIVISTFTNRVRDEQENK